MTKAKKKIKRINRTPQELLQAEYDKSLARTAAEEDGYLDSLVSQQETSAPALAPAPPALVPLLLTMAQVCELLNVSRTTFYRMRQAGEIPGAVTLGGQVRYHRETLEKWLLTKLVASP
jgi:excisionase family DNA binding protein